MPEDVQFRRRLNPAPSPVYRIVGRKDVSFPFLKRLDKIIVHIEAKDKLDALDKFKERYGDWFDEYRVSKASPKKYYLRGRIAEVDIEQALGDEYEVREE